MAYIQSIAHLINYFKKIYRDNKWDFGKKEFELLVEFYQWDKNYLKGKCVDSLTWEFQKSKEEITFDFIEKVKKICIERNEELSEAKEISDELCKELSERSGVSGVYFIYNSQKALLYIGRSFDLSSRILTSIQERQEGLPYYVRILNTKTKSDACVLEAYFIGKEKPAFNGDMVDIGEVTIKISKIPKRSDFIKIHKDNQKNKIL